MRFTLAQLEAFYWIARLGSFRAAARHLNLAQPTVSLRVRELERTLGRPLFDRAGHTVRLTGEGTALRTDVERILATTSRIESRAAALSPLRGLFRFGAPEGFAVSCLPHLINALEVAHPELELEIVIGTSDELLKMVEARRVDLTLVANPPSAAPDTRIEPLGHFEMSWVASPRLGLPAVIRPSDLAKVNIIATAPASPMYRMIQDWFLSRGLAPDRIHLCNTLAVISRLVADGIGVSVLPCAHLRQELESGALVVLECKPSLTKATMAAAFCAGEDGPAIRVVIEACRDVMAKTSYVELFAPHLAAVAAEAAEPQDDRPAGP